MERWKWITLLMCCYGFFKELRPSEAFLTPYLKSPDFKNLTENEVDNQIYPVATYATLAWLFVVLMTSDLLRQRPVLVLGAVAYVVTWILLIWGEGILTMQMMQFVYGLAVASEIAYYSYVYLIVDLDYYKRATSITRVVVLIGRCGSGILSQVLVSLHVFNYLQLNYISLSSVGVALILSFFMPKPRRMTLELSPPIDGASIELVDGDRDRKCCENCGSSVVEEIKSMVNALKQTYSNGAMLKWSLWWAFASCGYYQVGNYGQNLWDEISPARSNRKIYNGAVEAASTLLGAVLAYLVGFAPVDWNKFGELLLCVVCLVDGACLVLFAGTNDLYFAYCMYLVFRASYQPAITAAYFQIASLLRTERYGLVFGTNTFIALVLETIGTAIVVDKRGLNLPVREQFVVYGVYFGVIGLVFLVAAVITITNLIRQRRHQQFVNVDDNMPSVNNGESLADD